MGLAIWANRIAEQVQKHSVMQKHRDIYLSLDIEANGLIPGPYAMLSLGAAAFDIEGFFHRIGLDQFITSQRRNGLAGMIQRIRTSAAALESKP